MNFQWALLAATGGFAGSLLRYLISLKLPFQTTQFAWATFSVNMLGCLLIGILANSLDSPLWKAFLVAGILGGFTTFSGLGLELYKYLDAGFWQRALIYALTSFTLGTVLVYTGSKIALIWT